MNWMDYIVLGLCAVWAFLAVFFLIRQKRRGRTACGCSTGGCSGCCSDCSGCKKHKK